MPQLSAILLLDQGGHSTRGILYDLNGNLLCQASATVETYSPSPRFHEMDLAQIILSFSQVFLNIQQQAEQLGITRIIKAGLVVQRSSFLACRRDTLAPISPVISWMDSRNHAWLAAHHARFAAIQGITGLYPNAHYALSKIQWLLAHDAAIQQHAAHNNALFVPLAAFLANTLCASPNISVDGVIASRTLMMDFTDCNWCDELTSLAGISPMALPNIVNSDHDWGHIQLGNHSIPLTLCGGDQSFVAFSAGLLHCRDYAFVNVGSGAFIQAICDELPKQTRLLKSPLFIGRSLRYHVLEGTVNAAASALDELFKEIGLQSHADIQHALNTVSDAPIYLNLSAGSGSPYWLDAGTSSFSYDAGNEQKIVAVLENVVFSLTANWRNMQPYCNATQIAISGGLSLYDEFCQKLADCTGLSVTRFSDHEASARGAAYFMLNIANSNTLAERIFSTRENAPLLKRYQQFEAMMNRSCLTSDGYQ